MKRTLQALATVVVVGAIVTIGILARGGAKTESPARAGAVGAVGTPTQEAVVPADDVVPLTPAGTVEELPDCNTYASSVDIAVETIEVTAPGASVVAIATVTDVGPAQWNTPDGAPPSSDEDYDAMHVMRLVRLDVDRAIKGSASGALTAWIQGGKIGCSEFITSVAPRTISKGDQFALFLDETPPVTGLKGVLHPTAIWSVIDDGIETPGDGLMSLDRFADRVAAAGTN